MANSYKLSDGSKMEKPKIDRLKHKAKAKKLQQMEYPHCEECKRSSGVRLDMSHDISVDECQKSGRSELAWDVDNITMLCRSCHQKKDGLNIATLKIKYKTL